MTRRASAGTKHLWLLRHAHAAAHADTGEDFERLLDARGRLEAEDIGRQARGLGIALDHIVASPAARTQATAKAIARALQLPIERIRYDERIYEAERTTLATIVRALPSTAYDVLFVGHNPGISKLARWLTDDDSLPEFAPATLQLLVTEIDAWTHLGRGDAVAGSRLVPDPG